MQYPEVLWSDYWRGTLDCGLASPPIQLRPLWNNWHHTIQLRLARNNLTAKFLWEYEHARSQNLRMLGWSDPAKVVLVLIKLLKYTSGHRHNSIEINQANGQLFQGFKQAGHFRSWKMTEPGTGETRIDESCIMHLHLPGKFPSYVTAQSFLTLLFWRFVFAMDFSTSPFYFYLVPLDFKSSSVSVLRPTIPSTKLQ